VAPSTVQTPDVAKLTGGRTTRSPSAVRSPPTSRRRARERDRTARLGTRDHHPAELDVGCAGRREREGDVPSVPTSTLPYVPDVRSPGNVRVSSTTVWLIVTRAARLAWGQG